MEELSSAHKIFWPDLVQNLMKPSHSNDAPD